MQHIPRSFSLPISSGQTEILEHSTKDALPRHFSKITAAASRLVSNIPPNAFVSIRLDREMQVVDLKAAHALSAAEQWPHRLKDWADAMALGQGVVIGHTDQLKGTGMTWKWGSGHATLGLVIVHKDARGRGLGKLLMQQLLKPLEGRSVLLHATAAGKPVYEKLGFRDVGLISQYQGVVKNPAEISLPHGACLAFASSVDFNRLVALDQQAFGAPRKALIQQLMNNGEVVVLKENDRVIGFSVSREFGRGRVIGPVVASNVDLAKALISHGLVQASCSENPFVRLDVHAGSGLEAWLSGFNLKSAGGAVAMLKGQVPQRDPNLKSWALVSQSLG